MGTRAGRWGCRGLRTGEAKRGWQTGTASYEHEGAENMGGENMHEAVARVACRAVGGPREQGVGRGERAATMCGMAVAAGMAMRGAEVVASCPLDCLSNRVLQPVAETIKLSAVLFMFYLVYIFLQPTNA